MSPQKMPLANAAQEYFSNINPIASRIYADFEETKNSYDCLWNTLSFEEQSQVLNECIIKPEVTLQYNLKKTSGFCDNKPTSESFALKRVVDENVSYRDEHSAPFSFKTLSQVDLRLFGDSNKKVHVTPKIELPKFQPPIVSSVPPVTSPIIPVRYKSSETSSGGTGGLLGRLLGRRSSPGTDAENEALVSPQSPADTTTDTDTDTYTFVTEASSGTEASSMPKTGLDFLDNW